MMTQQPQNLFIACNRVAIVNEHANPHAAIRRPQQMVGQHAARFVAAKNIILKVEGSLRGVDYLCAGAKSI